MQKVLFFTAGPIPTNDELTAINKIKAAAAAPFELGIRNAAIPAQYQPKYEETVYVAGSPPAPYNDSEDFPVFNPDAPPSGDNLPATQAVVNNAQKITGVTGSGTVANITVNPTTKAITIALSAS